MILILNDKQINQDAARLLANRYRLGDVKSYYSFPNLAETKDIALYILDVGVSNEFQKNFSATLFCKKLIEDMHLPASIKEINFITSNFNDAYKNAIVSRDLLAFAEEVAQTMTEKFNRNITIRLPNAIEHKNVLVLPPLASELNWRVYGLNKPLMNGISEQNAIKGKPIFLNGMVHNKENVTYNLPEEITKDADLIWEGEDMLAWLKEPKNEVQSRSIDNKCSIS